MPVVIVWFAIFAVGAGTFAVLHGKDESKDHDQEYQKASKELERASTSGPFEEALKEESESAEGESEAGGEEGESGGSESSEGEAGESGAEEAGTAEAGSVETGAAVFSENCSTCHGASGEGGNGGPDLNTMPLAKTEEGVIQQVTNGGGGMPPFGGSLSEEEIKGVAAYVVQEITHGE
ncbi:MAG: c-type cytochrome [Actinobacteria bacterium]|nr:c-type cytochrome [Actinomycetota bacterium]